MSVATKNPTAAKVFNVPNQLTAARLIIAVVMFFFIAYQWYGTSLMLFVIAASTDWLDGYWARKYGQVTTLGRILDPFVDKIVICGAFIFLAAVPGSEIRAWMAVVVVGRELLVTALRGYLEGEGADFSAGMSGKLKMVLQCFAAGLSLWTLTPEAARPEWFVDLLAIIHFPEILVWALPIAVWSAVVLTLYSGLEYILKAVSLLRRSL